MVEVTIETLSYGGRGVTRIDVKAWFIEEQRPESESGFGRSAKGTPTNLGRRSMCWMPVRKELSSDADILFVCGDCALQPPSSVGQVRFNEESLKDQLRRLGRVRSQRIVEPLRGSP